MLTREAVKVLPFGDVWNEYCRRAGVPDDVGTLSAVKTYEKNVLAKR